MQAPSRAACDMDGKVGFDTMGAQAGNRSRDQRPVPRYGIVRSSYLIGGELLGIDPALTTLRLLLVGWQMANVGGRQKKGLGQEMTRKKGRGFVVPCSGQ